MNAIRNIFHGLVSLAALVALCGVFGTTQAQAATYDIDMTLANLHNLNSWCDGTGARRYNGCNSTNFWCGFNVPSTAIGAGEVVTSISMDYFPGINCRSGLILQMQLNGSLAPESIPQGTDCFCSGTPDATATFTFDPADWNDSGTNQFRLGNLFGSVSCLGPNLTGSAYSILHIETSGGAVIECDLSPIEAKLDDEFRFSDDDEVREVRDEWNGQLAALEAKMDDLSTEMCDIVRLLHTPSGIRTADCGGQHYVWNADGTVHD